MLSLTFLQCINGPHSLPDLCFFYQTDQYLFSKILSTDVVTPLINSQFLFMPSRCLLRLVCETHQVCGFLREVPPAAHALPVLPAVFLSLQLKPTERRRVRRGEQHPCRQAPEGPAGIGPNSNRDSNLAQDFPFNG